MPAGGKASTGGSGSPTRPANTAIDRSRILTVPNVLSFGRVAAVPFVAWAIVHRGTEAAGLLAFALIASTDWIDGYVARRTGTVTDLGKLLDPVADRLIVVTVLVALVVRGAFPVWAATVVVARDVALLAVGGVALAVRGVRIDVRRIGKAATLALMLGVPLVAWGALDLWAAPLASITGWVAYGVGVVLAYAAAAWYAADLRHALARTHG